MYNPKIIAEEIRDMAQELREAVKDTALTSDAIYFAASDLTYVANKFAAVSCDNDGQPVFGDDVQRALANVGDAQVLVLETVTTLMDSVKQLRNATTELNLARLQAEGA
ncbi:MAG: hypothetical protein J5497_05480 [Selenomonadaceae bacterium]|nr:hypothetical protein [Selenomonadaceae bacterium]